MLLASKLKKGDIIRIVAPSNKVGTPRRKQVLLDGIKIIEEKGFQVEFSEHLFDVCPYGINAGTPQARADDINNAFADNKVKAIWCYAGGLSASDVLSLLDYELIKQNPKIFCGMSDVDTLNLGINTKTGLVTFNTSDPRKKPGQLLDDSYSVKSFIERFEQVKIGFVEPARKRKCLRSGIAQGTLIICNLNVLVSLAGTEYFSLFDTDTILAIETISENTRSLHRNLEHLKLLGAFKNIKGIILGHQEKFNENTDFTVSAEQVVLDDTEELGIPVLKTENFGHNCANAFLPLGAQVKIDADAKTIELVEQYLAD